MVPSVSKKQRRKMGSLYEQGKITDKEWEHHKVIKPNRRKKVGGKKRK